MTKGELIIMEKKIVIFIDLEGTLTSENEIRI